MKKTLQDQYLLIKEGKGHKGVFIKEAKRQFPGLIRNSATYTEVANVLQRACLKKFLADRTFDCLIRLEPRCQ